MVCVCEDTLRSPPSPLYVLNDETILDTILQVDTLIISQLRRKQIILGWDCFVFWIDSELIYELIVNCYFCHARREAIAGCFAKPFTGSKV